MGTNEGNVGRTLLKLTASDDCVAMRTVSRSGRSPHTFYMTKSNLERLENEGYVLVRDLQSFAEFRKSEPEDALFIRFAWLSADRNGAVTGRTEDVRVSLEKFREFLASGRDEAVLLSREGTRMPRLDFSRAGKTLRTVASDPVRRRALSKCLSREFRWPRTKAVEFYPDSERSSFFFREVRPDGSEGICGGLIWHTDARSGGRYAVHT